MSQKMPQQIPEQMAQEDIAWKLRPHHFLCTQAYKGMGYSEEFSVKMESLLREVRQEEQTMIELVTSTDDLCAVCPHKLGEDLCESNEHIKQLDAAVMRYMPLKNHEKYSYQETVAAIRDRMTEEMIDDICGSCEWYEMTCREFFRKMIRDESGSCRG